MCYNIIDDKTYKGGYQMSFNVRNYSNKEMLLFPARIGDYLPKDHLAWVIDEVVDQLDLRCLYAKVPSIGNPSYHPKMMLKILFYGYATSTFSSRKIKKELESDVAFIFLSGMQKPDFRTISDFRKNNAEELPKLFVQIVRLCHKLGLIGLGHISLDSTVMKANANRRQFHDKKDLAEEERALKKKIQELLDTAEAVDDEEDKLFGPNSRGDELPEELRDPKVRLEKIKEAQKKLEEEGLKEINLTDADATFQKHNSHLIRPGYRAEIAADEKEQVIIACDCINEANDTRQLVPLLDEVTSNLPEVSTHESVVVTADSNYSSIDSLAKLEAKKHIDAYIPDAKYQAQKNGNLTDEDSPFHKKYFVYNPEKDVYVCPNGKELTFKRRKYSKDQSPSSVYICSRYECRKCRYFGSCTKSRAGREIHVYDNIASFFIKCARSLRLLTAEVSTKGARLSLNLFSQISNTTYASGNSSCVA
jgi:transposase